MFEQDYILRMIHEIVRMAMKLLCGVDIDRPEAETLETREERDRLHHLLELADSGEIDRAENQLFEALAPGDTAALKTALLFYRHLGQLDDAFLEAHGFSREEVLQGLHDVLSRWGAPELADTLSPELYQED